MTQDKSTMPELKSCPFCGSKPVVGLGKKTGCQLHGDPMQSVTIACAAKHCPVNPGVRGGDIYNGGKQKAVSQIAPLWNTRAVPTELLNEMGEALAIAEQALRELQNKSPWWFRGWLDKAQKPVTETLSKYTAWKQNGGKE